MTATMRFWRLGQPPTLLDAWCSNCRALSSCECSGRLIARQSIDSDQGKTRCSPRSPVKFERKVGLA
jgi:hypothetical protein